MTSAIERRIDQLVRLIGFGGPKTITIAVPTLVTYAEGSLDGVSSVVPEVEAKVDAFLESGGMTDDDLVIRVARFYGAPENNGETEPTPIPLETGQPNLRKEASDE